MSSKRPYDQDPDYDEIPTEVQEKRKKTIEDDLKKQKRATVEGILQGQFDEEIFNKDNEIEKLDDLLQESRCVLDRLRACIVTKYYTAPPDEQLGSPKSEETSYIHPAIKKYLSKSPKYHTQMVPKPVAVATQSTKIPPLIAAVENETNDTGVTKEEPVPSHVPRIRNKYEIVIGNVSKFIPQSQRLGSDLTHIWKAYVREGRGYPKLSTVARKVCFLLHPSFRPNDVVEVVNPPYEISRKGWGSFPLRVQVHFKDQYNKPVDIIHNLKLDKTFLGLTTLGPETHAEIKLYRSKELVEAENSMPGVASCASISETVAAMNSSNMESKDSPNQVAALIQPIAEQTVQQNGELTEQISPSRDKVVPNNNTEMKSTSLIKKLLQNSVEPKTVAAFKKASIGHILNGSTPFIKCTDSQGRLLLVPQSSLVHLKSSAKKESGSSIVLESPKKQLEKGDDGKMEKKLPLYVLKVLSSQENKQSQVLLLPKSGSSVTKATILPPPRPAEGSNAVVLNGLPVADLKPKFDLPAREVTKMNGLKHQLQHHYQALRTMDLSTCVDFESTLKKALNLFPLISEGQFALPFSSPSFEKYLTWNIGKKRAAEWQRAGMVRTAMLYLIGRKSEVCSKYEDLWSRKQIVSFCRRHGYTPQCGESNNSDGNSSVMPISADTSCESTLSDAKELLERVKQSDRQLLEDELVDVDSVFSSEDAPCPPCNPPRVNHVTSHLRVLPELHSSLPAVFVKDTASQISIDLKPVELEPGMGIPVLEEMILAACKSFSEAILRSAVNESYKRMGGRMCGDVSSDEVSVSDVNIAIQKDSVFEFLTNRYLGAARDSEHSVNS